MAMQLFRHSPVSESTLTKSRPCLLELRSSTWFITVTAATAIFTDVFLYAVIVPVFPFSLQDRIGIDESEIQHWLSVLLSVYGVGLIVFAPFFGWLSDRINERRYVLLGGLVVLGGATVMLCLARNLALLITGRLLQGAAAASVWVVGLALLADTSGEEGAGQAMGYVGLAYSLAALVAPLLGGVVYQNAGYYAVFAMAFGIIGLDIMMRLALIEKKVARKWSAEQTAQEVELDEESARLPDGGPKMKHQTGPLEDIEIQLSSEVSGRRDSVKRVRPILILLKSKRMQATFWASTADAILFTSFDVTLPLFVADTFHWSSLGGGLIFLALLTPTFIQPVFGRFVDKHGPRWIAVTGFVTCVPPFICLRFITHNTMGQKVLLCAMLAVIGLGISLSVAATMAEFTIICAEKERKKPGSMGKGGAYAQSYGIFNVSWALGSLVGSYWAGGVREAAGWGTMGLSFAILCAIVSVPTCLYIGGSLMESKMWKRYRGHRKSRSRG